MGWERKRGKLSEFNRLIRGDRGQTNYNVLSGDPDDLRAVKFIITLDADTILPRESARRLVGTIAHPLNAPVFDPIKRRVVEGYGVLQPRVSYHLHAATRSRFAGLLAASAGIDPYSNAVSDTYMDLFGLGTFTGKGIYDLDAFEAAVGHTFPDNRILSHDLIEGNYARCGLVTDVELFDDFPPRYHAYAMREHRWARGDWQLLPWLGANVPGPDGPKPNPLPVLERWKIFDNLRRCLVPPSLVILLVLGWTVLPGSPWLWTLLRPGGPDAPGRPDDSGGELRVAQAAFLGWSARRRPHHAGDGGPGFALDRLFGRSGPTAPRRDRPDAYTACSCRIAKHAGVGNRRRDRASPRDGDRQLHPGDVAFPRVRPGDGDRDRVRPPLGLARAVAGLARLVRRARRRLTGSADRSGSKRFH